MADSAGMLRSFTLPSLEEGKTYKLNSPCAWGPRRVGNRVMLTTDKGKLFCLDDRQELLWQVDSPYGPLAGMPWEAGDSYVLASQRGVVWRVDAATGKELSKVEAGCPLGTGVADLGGRLFVGSADGCVYEVKMP
jgi:outer membrane protein assembly factor BamB